MLTASVFVNIPVKSIAKAYTYRVPVELSYVGAGWRVFVPFGGRKVEGFILATAEQSAEELGKIQLKDIQDVVDEEAWFSPAMIRAARWLASFYLCSLAEMMRLFMPGKSGLKISVQYAADESQRRVPTDDFALPQPESAEQAFRQAAPQGEGNEHQRGDGDAGDRRCR